MARLPYDATHNTEALLQCVIELLIRCSDNLKEGDDDYDIKKRRLEHLESGVKMAVTGVPLTNQKGREAWLLLLNSIIFTFESLLKLRNMQNYMPWVGKYRLTNMRAFLRVSKQEKNLRLANAPNLPLRDASPPVEKHFILWREQ